VRDELVDRYGPLPDPVERLLAVAAFRVVARRYGLTEVTLQGNQVRFAPLDLRESQVMRLQRLFPRSVAKPQTRTVLVPRPMTARIGGPARPRRRAARLVPRRARRRRRRQRQRGGGHRLRLLASSTRPPARPPWHPGVA
jgi:hypothetical protein